MTQRQARDIGRTHPARLETMLVGESFRLDRAWVVRPRVEDEAPPATGLAPLLLDAQHTRRLDEDASLFPRLANGGFVHRLRRLEPAGGAIPELSVLPFSDEEDVAVVLDDDEDEEHRRNANAGHASIVRRRFVHSRHRLPHFRATIARVYPGDLLAHLRSFSVLAACVDRGARHAYSDAARELAVDVSVLRRRMQSLAAWVGAALVDGRGSGLRITRAGERTRDLAQRALAAVEALPAGEDVGPLRVACTGTFLAEVLPPVLAVVRDRHRALRFRVRREGASASRELLARGEIDFAIVRSPKPPDDLSSRRLGRDRLWLATSKDSALASASRMTIEAMSREPLIGYSSASSTMRRLMEVLRPHGVTPWIEVDGKTAALRYVAAGLGIAFVSLLAGQEPSHPKVAVRDVTSLFPAVSFHLVWPKHAALEGFRRTFVDALLASSGSPAIPARTR